LGGPGRAGKPERGARGDLRKYKGKHRTENRCTATETKRRKNKSWGGSAALGGRGEQTFDDGTDGEGQGVSFRRIPKLKKRRRVDIATT